MMKVLKSRNSAGSRSMVLPVEKQCKHKNFFVPLKKFLYFGWFVGFFPINFDKTLQKFQFKICSLTTFFSILRAVILLTFLTMSVCFTPDETTESNTSNSTEASDETRSFKFDSVTTTMNFVTRYLNLATLVIPFVFGSCMASPFEKLSEITAEEDFDTLPHNSLKKKTLLKMTIVLIALICGKFFNFVYIAVRWNISEPFILYEWFLYIVFFNVILRCVFFFYEVIFFHSFGTIKNDILAFYETKTSKGSLFKTCDLLCRKINKVKEAFSVFLFLDLSMLTLFWILR